MSKMTFLALRRLSKQHRCTQYNIDPASVAHQFPIELSEMDREILNPNVG